MDPKDIEDFKNSPKDNCGADEPEVESLIRKV